MTKDILDLCKKAADIILSFSKSTRIRVVSHYDADGITAAAIICKALCKEGYNFQASLMRNPFDLGLKRLKKEENDLIIFTDMGSGQINKLEEFNCQIIIIDHHQLIKEESKENLLQINANLCGINGNYEACGSSLCYSVGVAINPENKDLAAFALAGATGDKQYIGGIRGYNKKILDEALENNILKEYTDKKLYGETLSDALYYSVDPYYNGISGNKKGIENLIDKFGLNKDIKIEEMDEEINNKLNSFLFLKLIKNNSQKNILDTIIRKRYWSETLQSELERFADLLDSCGKGGNRGLGLALCLGDKNAYNEAIILEKDYKQKILDELLKLNENGVFEKKSYRFFYSVDSSLGGVVGGIATNFILDDKKPLISLVKKEDEIHISCRGNQKLVEMGLDLGYAMKIIAEKLNGKGGGHKIAAGATISSEKEKEFLELTDKVIAEQMM